MVSVESAIGGICRIVLLDFWSIVQIGKITVLEADLETYIALFPACQL